MFFTALNFLALALAPIVAAAPRSSRSASNVTMANLSGSVGGSAYAGYLFSTVAGVSLRVGPLFPAALSCTGTSNTSGSTGASLALGTSASGGAVSDQVHATRTPTAVTVQASAQVQNVHILNDLITADAVNAVVTSTADATSASSMNNSTFSNLVVAGQVVTSTPAPNTRIMLANLGYVVVNEQSGPVNSADVTSIQVSAIDVYITTDNTLGLPVGARIILAHSYSSFARTTPHDLLASYTWGLYLNLLGGVIPSGPYGAVGVGCAGGSGAATVASVSAPLILTLGTITDTATGQVSGATASSTVQSTVQNVQLIPAVLTTLLHIEVITAKATVTHDGSGYAGTATTTLTNGVLAGAPLSATPGPNTHLTLPLLGYAYLNEQTIITTASSVKVNLNALDIVITQANTLGLPVGSRIIIGHADASINA